MLKWTGRRLTVPITLPSILTRSLGRKLSEISDVLEIEDNLLNYESIEYGGCGLTRNRAVHFI